MLKRFFLVSLAVVFMAVAGSISSAQEMEGMDEMLEFTFGTVVRVGNNEITILEYSFEEEKEVEVTYALTDITEFINIDALSALQIGDEIEIEFKEEGGNRIVTAIAKDDEVLMEEMDMMEEAS